MMVTQVICLLFRGMQLGCLLSLTSTIRCVRPGNKKNGSRKSPVQLLEEQYQKPTVASAACRFCHFTSLAVRLYSFGMLELPLNGRSGAAPGLPDPAPGGSQRLF